MRVWRRVHSRGGRGPGRRRRSTERRRGAGSHVAGEDPPLRDWSREWYEAWESLEEDVEELIDAGEHVVSVVTGRARGRASGLEGEFPFAAVWTVRDGKVVRVVGFPTREEALEAAGLRE